MNRLFCLVAATVLVTACGNHSAPESATVLVNINAYTLENGKVIRFSELAFDQGRIIATGNGELAGDYRPEQTIDGGGNTVLPGLIDAHGHVSSLGSVKERIDLAGSASLDQALGRIRQFAEANPDAPWLLGRGWNQVVWGQSDFPDRHDLDAIVSDRPVWLRRIDGHAGWANTAALTAAGIDETTTDPVGGRILHDESGKPTGLLVDTAMAYLEQQIPALRDEDYRRMTLAAGDELLSLGITTVHDPGISAREAGVMKALAAENALPIRIYAMLAGAGAELDAWGEPLLDFADGMFAVRAVKIYADGALGSRGAALIDEYSDEAGNSGLLFADGQELGDAIAKSNDAGFQANVHAIGDLANRVVLDGFERVQNAQPSALRNRIEHAQIVALEDIPRFAELGIIASMQPVHATSDMNMAEDRLGSERIKGGYAWRRMLDAGVRVASGSDFPVEYPNPMLGLHAAVNRTDTAGNPVGGWFKDQALSRAEALSSFTEEAAYAGHQEADLGRLAPGYRADFIVLDRDYFDIPASEIWQIKVLETWLGGERRYRAAESGE